ncbi:MAG: TetR/AcrR family transcriptional regulator [Kofleriaceae bacterium]
MPSSKPKPQAKRRSAAPRAGAASGARGARRSTPRVRLDNDERRAQLLALARRAFDERTYDDVSLEDIAASAGISKALLYHYFATKRELYVAGLRETARELVGSVVAVVDPARSPVDRVRAALDAYLTHVEDTGGAFVALMRGGIGSDPEVAAVLEETRQAFLAQFLAQSPVAQQFLDEPLIRLAARGWIGMVEAVSIDWVGTRAAPRRVVRDLLVENLLAVMGNARSALLAGGIRQGT